MQFRSFRWLPVFATLGLLVVPASLPQDKGNKSDDADEGVKQTIEGLVRDIACPVQNHKSTSRDFNFAVHARLCKTRLTPSDID